MVLKKLVRTLRREGLEGLVARVRHPHRPIDLSEFTPKPRLPFRLKGSRNSLTDAVQDALVSLLGPDALSSESHSTTIHISPGADECALAPGDVILFEAKAAAWRFLEAKPASEPNSWELSKCSAVLLPSSDCLLPFQDAGVGYGRLFVFPSLSSPGEADQPDLYAGIARWLIAAGVIGPLEVETTLFPPLREIVAGDRLCLSLPESLERRAGFLNMGLEGFKIFDGVRRLPGWHGVGWSYVTIARAALERKAVPLLVCEDDMRVEETFIRRLEAVEGYLKKVEWDLFSGLLTNFPEDITIHHVEQRDDLTFVHLDYAIGMVCNIYGHRALARIREWSPAGGSHDCRTIDEWLSRMPNFRVITALPFLVSHDADASSTVFGFANKRYEVMIRSSERRLAKMVERYVNTNHGI